MFTPPIVSRLERHKTILLAGMGGGYDLLSALPLFFELNAKGIECHLANLSFARNLAEKRHPNDSCELGPFVVDARASLYPAKSFQESLGFPANYFPEFHISRYLLESHQIDIPVHAIKLLNSAGEKPLGVAELRDAYERMVARYAIDALVLVDAGVDSVLIGDEEAIGTYSEDFLSMLAVQSVHVPVYLQCVGLGTEGGICVIDFLRNLATHASRGAFLGAVHWSAEMPSVRHYMNALLACVPSNTSINSAIVAALEHRFGGYCPPHLSVRGIVSGDLSIQALMTTCFYFDMHRVLESRLFVEECRGATSLDDLRLRFDEARCVAGLCDPSGNYNGRRTYDGEFEALIARQDRATRQPRGR